MRRTRGTGVQAPQLGSEELKNKHNEHVDCEICGGQYTYRNRNVHFKTIMHQEAATTEVTKYAPKHKMIFCTFCNNGITKNNYSTHLKTKKHRDNIILCSRPAPANIGADEPEIIITGNIKCDLCGINFDNYLDLEEHNTSDKHLELELTLVNVS